MWYTGDDEDINRPSHLKLRRRRPDEEYHLSHSVFGSAPSLLEQSHRRNANEFQLPGVPEKATSFQEREADRWLAKHQATIEEQPDCLDAAERKHASIDTPTEASGDIDTPSFISQMKAVFGAWVALLFAFVPAGFAVYYTRQPAVTVFIINFVAIFPSSFTITYAIEEINMYVGDKLEGLINMSFGNAAQLISSILLLKTQQLDILRASLIGTMLQNLLLMSGLSFFFGGLRRQEQYVNARVAQTMGMFLLLAV